MSIYTLSSTDPEHYNIIRANLPIEHTTLFCNITVTSLTSNCNIQVLSSEDYITFNINGTKYTARMKDYSKITSATVSTIFQEIFDEQNIPITVSTSNLDTIIFDSKIYGDDGKFEITDLSYNMKLLTGLYSIKDADFPLVSSTYDSEQQIVRENVYIDKVNITPEIKTTTDERFTINYTLEPLNAYGYSISIKPDEQYEDLIIDGVIMTAKNTGTYNVTVEFRNYDVPESIPTKFTYNVVITVDIKSFEEITNITAKDIDIYVHDTSILIPDIQPHNANYELIYESADPSIASISNNIVTGVAPGSTTIKIHCNYNVQGGQKEKVHTVNVNVKSDKVPIVINRYISSTVGYYLSTPILYLLTSIGAQVFCNDIDDARKMNSGNIAMILNNSFSANFPIVAQQYDITTRTTINYTSDLYFILVDANMHHVKLLNPMYVTIKLEPEIIKVVQ